MVATLAEIKVLLGLSDTTKDALITANMPLVENAIISYCKNDFVEYNQLTPGMPRVFIQTDNIRFVSGTNSVDRTDTSIDLSSYKLAVGDNLKIYDSYHNNKVFTIKTITADSIVFESVNTVKAEDNSEWVTIARVVYPEEIKRVYSMMINYNLNKSNLSGLESESILGYSYKISPSNIYGYPDAFMGELSPYRKIIRRPLFNNNYAGGVKFYGH
jgi:ATP-dependent helicase/DNAse subunit B